MLNLRAQAILTDQLFIFLVMLVSISTPVLIGSARLFGTQLERLTHLSEAAPRVGITAMSSERREDAGEDFALRKTHPACVERLDRKNVLVVEQTRCQPL